MKTENNIENEVQKLFNSLPIQKGIQMIIKESNQNFEYGITFSGFGNHEVWYTELNEFQYIDSPTKKIKLELSQDSKEKSKNCYNTSLRIFYENEEIMMEEFFKIKEKFEELGDKVDTETVMTEDYIMKSQIVIIYFKKGKEIPNLAFSFLKEEQFDEYQVFVNYQNCLNK